jgi:AraC-like DNA-binding protein
VADRLRDLLDLVLGSLDDPGAGGAELARRASFSRDHLDRLVAAATGETPVGLRRRLLLERAAWALRSGAPASEVAGAAGYGSLAAFSRAFSRAHGVPPSAFAASDRPTAIPAPNGVHFLAPAGFSVPRAGTTTWAGAADGAGVADGADGTRRAGTTTWAGTTARAGVADRADGTRRAGTTTRAGGGADPPGDWAPTAQRTPRDLTERMVLHHLARVRELLEAAVPLSPAALARPVRPGFVAVWVDGEEPSAALMAERLVVTLEVWLAAVAGDSLPGDGLPGSAGPSAGPEALLGRLDRAGPAFSALARRVRDGGAWDDAFVDALCEPPQAFTLGGVLSHVLAYGAIRREMLASVLVELGAEVPSLGDPLAWEAGQ